jgi:hypothetical protein
MAEVEDEINPVREGRIRGDQSLPVPDEAAHVRLPGKPGLLETQGEFPVILAEGGGGKIALRIERGRFHDGYFSTGRALFAIPI